MPETKVNYMSSSINPYLAKIAEDPDIGPNVDPEVTTQHRSARIRIEDQTSLRKKYTSVSYRHSYL